MSDSLSLERAPARPRDAFFTAAMAAVLGIRALVFLIGLLAMVTAGSRLNLEHSSGHAWVAWDGCHYLYILLHGYSPDMLTEHHFYTIAFFPLYPFTARLLSIWMAPTTAMVLISNTCAIVGFGFLYDWARRLTDARTAFICVLIAATYPGALFFSAGMTEAPFLMLVSIVFWLLQRERFWPAALVTAVATATRPTGVTLALVLVVYAWLRHSHLPLSRRAAMVGGLGLLAGTGGMIYEVFLWHRYGVFDAYMRAQAGWANVDAGMLAEQAAQGVKRYSPQFFLERATRPQAWNRAVALVIVAVTLVGLFKSTRIPRVFFLLPLAIFLMTWLPNEGLRSSSIVRYESSAIPLYLLAATWLSRNDRRPVLLTVLGAMFLMQIYYAVLFTRGIWVG